MSPQWFFVALPVVSKEYLWQITHFKVPNMDWLWVVAFDEMYKVVFE